MIARDSACLEQRDCTRQDAQNGIPARPQGARRLKRIPFPPTRPKLPRQLDHRGGTLRGDGRLRATLEEKRVLARWGWVGEKGVIFSILLQEFCLDQVADLTGGVT
jgi:hypothetical protein